MYLRYLKFMIEFEIQYTAHTMDCNDSDLEAFWIQSLCNDMS